MRLSLYGHIHIQNNELRAIVDTKIPGKEAQEADQEGNGLLPKGHAGNADHPGGCPVQNTLEIKNWGR